MTVSSGSAETKLACHRQGRPGRWWSAAFLVPWGITAAFAADSTTANPAPPTPAIESRFRQALDRPLIAGRERVPIREILNRLAEERNVAILLDRRIDPGRLISVRLNAPAFDLGIREIAALIAADVSVVADTLVVAPADDARTLRTRIDLIDEKRDRLAEFSVGRKFELVRRATVRWDRLATPADVLARICEGWGITLQNPEAIEHDCWEAGMIAHANATEALMLVAGQFDLEIEWVTSESVRFVPQVDHPAIERSHRPKGLPLGEARQRIEAAFPDVAVEELGGALQVLGTVEDHEEIAVLIGARPPRKSLVETAPTPLARRRFTLRFAGLPVTALFEELKRQGISIEYDPDQLTAGGANLEGKLSLDLKQAPIEELLRQACEPVGIGFQIDGERIRLSPAIREP